MNKPKYIFFISLLMLIIAAPSCYTFKDASTEGLSSVKVNFFPNQSQVINPNLSQEFTERLKDKILRESNLKLKDENPDVEFQGAITGYVTNPVAATSSETAALTRLTISVRIEYINHLNEKKSWQNTFTQFADFDSNVNFSAVEARLVEEINTKLVEDIFNRAFVNW